MNERNNYGFTNEDLITIDTIIDTTLRQTGIKHFRGISSLIYELNNGITSIDNQRGTIISLSTNGVNFIKMLADIELKTRGLSSIEKVTRLIHILNNPIPIEKKEEHVESANHSDEKSKETKKGTDKNGKR